MAPRSRISGTGVRKFVGLFCLLFGFVSESPGEDSGNLNFEIAATRASRDFPEKPRGVLSGEAAPRVGRGALSGWGGTTPPRAICGRSAHLAEQERNQPVPRREQAPRGWKPGLTGPARKIEAGPRRPPPHLDPGDPSGFPAATTRVEPGAGARAARSPLAPHRRPGVPPIRAPAAARPHPRPRPAPRPPALPRRTHRRPRSQSSREV